MTILYFCLYFIPLALTVFKGIPFIVEILGNEYYLKIICFTVFQAVISSFLSLVVGLPGAFIMAKRTFRGKRFLSAVYRIPFVLPSVLTVLGFVIFFGNNGYLNLLLCKLFKLSVGPVRILYSFKAVLLAHVFYNFSVVISIVSAMWSNLDENVENAARIMGASELRVFFSVTLPRLKSAIFSSCALVFLYCFSSFAIILILGGSPDLTTTEVEIYRLGRMLFETDKASALAIVSSFIACLMLFINRKIQGSSYREHGGLVKKKLRIKILSIPYLIVTSFFIVSPVLSVVIRSFLKKQTRLSSFMFTFDSYRNIDFKIISVTVLIGVLSALLSTCMAIGFCKRRIKTDIPVLLPLATSSVILGLGYFVISKFLGSINSVVLIILVHSVINTGFAYKTIQPAFDNIPSEIIEQAIICGSTKRMVTLNVTIPIINKSFITAFLFCFALSCGELNSTLLLGNGNVNTITVTIYRLIGSYNYHGACAFGTILITICFLMFFLAEDKRGTCKNEIY